MVSLILYSRSNTKQDIDLRIHNILGEVIFTETLTEFSGGLQ